MNAFAAVAIQNRTQYTKTENGMDTLVSSKSALVDFFFLCGAARQRPDKEVVAKFEAAYREDRILALRLLFYARDVRGGAGERRLFRVIMKHLENEHRSDLDMIIPIVPEYGRFDDLLVFETKYAFSQVVQFFRFIIQESEGETKNEARLLGKWLPRKGPVAVRLTKEFGMSPRQYRKMIVGMTDVVEQKMSAKEFSEINYATVPSIAANRYQKAFNKRDHERYSAYREALKQGKTKINASAIFPHEITRNLLQNLGEANVASAQWQALPNYLEGSDGFILPMADVSGSMNSIVSGTTRAIDVCVGLTLYLADKQKGPFQDLFLTFSDTPEFQHLKGDIKSKVSQINTVNWENNTNIEAAFELILATAKKGRVKPDQMPKYLLIMSDMEFDSATNSRTRRQKTTAFDVVRDKYEKAGYTLPNIVFWNLTSRHDNNPVRFDEKGTALISGFSPAILKAILSTKLEVETMTPEAVMMAALSNPRYAELFAKQ